MIKYLKRSEAEVARGNVLDTPSIVKAAYQRDCKLVLLLLNDGADINAADPRDNLSILHIACMQGDDELVDLLLDWDGLHGNLDFTAKSKYCPRSAWQYAAKWDRADLAMKVRQAEIDRRTPRDLIPTL